MADEEEAPKPPRRHKVGYEWTNHRGQVFVYLPDHHLARRDGFVARSKVVAEALEGRDLLPDERVLHWPDTSPGNDDPANLMVFPSMTALNQFRRDRYYETEDQEVRERLFGLTERAKDLRRQRQLEEAHRDELARKKVRCPVCKGKKVRTDPASGETFEGEPCTTCNNTGKISALEAEELAS